MKRILIFGVIAIMLLVLWTCGSAINPFNPEEMAVIENNTTASGSDISYNGNDTNKNDVMLQAFHWDSHDSSSWWNVVNNLSSTIGDYFTVVWLPPPSKAGSDEGYIPTEWYNLNSNYGTQTELKSLISSLHTEGVKVLADIVVNHRGATSQCSHGNWVYFSNPTMTGDENFLDGQLKDGCNNGDGVWSEGTWSYGGRTYTCDDFDGNNIADLNHWKLDTRNDIQYWLGWLKDSNNAGFDGWRYDFIRGYDPQYLGGYNDAGSTATYLSVGEYWKSPDGRQALADIVNRSGQKTMVFDFTTKLAMHNAFDTNTITGGDLASTGENGDKGLIGWWSNAAVTLVDNHDTGACHGQNHWPMPTPCNGDLITVKAAYAYILTHPGIPVIYWADWRDRNSDLQYIIEQAIKIRRSNNVKRDSRVWVDKAENGLYAAYIGTQDAEEVAIKIGNQGWSNYENWTPNSNLGLTKTLERHYNGGHAFCIYYKNTAN